MNNAENLNQLLSEKNYDEAAGAIIGLCSSFSTCGSCDVCKENAEKWLKKDIGDDKK